MRAMLLSAAIASALLAGACGRRVSDTVPDAGDPVVGNAAGRLPLPAFDPGVSRYQIESALAGWGPAHRFTSDGASPEGWEWSGPDGGRVEAYFLEGRVAGVHVSRTWGAGAPPVDGHHLPDEFVGAALARVDDAIGPGLLVSREWFQPGSGPARILESYRWAIHDREVDTGLFLVVRARDGRVEVVHHRWSRR